MDSDIEKNCVIFFDTETTGLPKKQYNKYFSPKKLEEYDSSRLASIAWIKTNFSYEIISKGYHYVKPDNWTVCPEALKVNSLTDQILNEKGLHIAQIIDIFAEEMKDVKFLVAHNIAFDIRIILSEIYRTNNLEFYKDISNIKQYCSMKLFATSYPNMAGENKTIKLRTAYEFIKHEKDDLNYHDAMDDTLMCYRIFYFIIDKHNKTIT